MDREKNGIVASIRLSHNPFENTYNIISERVLQAKSNMKYDLYDEVAIKEGQIDESKEPVQNRAAYEPAISALLGSADINGNSKRINLHGKDYSKTAEKLMGELRSAAKLLVRGFLSGAPIVVRFHNDGDGSTGGIALYRALSALQEKFFINERAVSWNMNRGIAYTMESFYSDKMLFDSYRSAEKPIVVITDFGTSPESADAIREARGVCDLIWLDHHVPYEGFPKEMIRHYINVFDFGGDSSFTAGLLTCIFAEVISGVEVEDLKAAALVSDYSAYADFKDPEALKNSIILDYLTSSPNEMHGKPKHMDMILRDREKSDSTFRHANGLLEEALSTGIKNIRKYRNAQGVNICLLDFGHIAKLRGDYPLPGRYSSKLQDRMEVSNGGKTLTLVHYGSYISMRSSPDIRDSVDILAIIERLKKATNGSVSGGGHRQAASVRTDRDHIKEVTRLLLMELGIDQE